MSFSIQRVVMIRFHTQLQSTKRVSSYKADHNCKHISGHCGQVPSIHIHIEIKRKACMLCVNVKFKKKGKKRQISQTIYAELDFRD